MPVTALACIWLSRDPIEALSNWTSDTWYGEPGMFPAPVPAPQFACHATWAPNHSTTPQVPAVGPLVEHREPLASTVNVITTCVSLSAA